MAYFCCKPREDYSRNADLVIGTPEYNKIRYPNSKGAFPKWKEDINAQLRLKATNKWKFTGLGTYHPARELLINDLRHCITYSLHFKTKTFEYSPSSGKFNVIGKHIATLDKDTGLISSFTIKNIDTELSRYRLRDLGVHLLHKGIKTYWIFNIAENYYHYLIGLYEGLDNLINKFKSIFPSIKIKSGIENNYGNYRIYCELIPDLTYSTAFLDIEEIIEGRNHMLNDVYNYSSIFIKGIEEEVTLSHGTLGPGISEISRETFEADCSLTLSNVLALPDTLREYNFGKFISVLMENIITLPMFRCNNGEYVTVIMSHTGYRIHLWKNRVEVFTVDGNLTEFLLPSPYFSLDEYFHNGKLVVKPRGKEDLELLFSNYTKEITLFSKDRCTEYFIDNGSLRLDGHKHLLHALLGREFLVSFD